MTQQARGRASEAGSAAGKGRWRSRYQSRRDAFADGACIVHTTAFAACPPPSPPTAHIARMDGHNAGRARHGRQMREEVAPVEGFRHDGKRVLRRGCTRRWWCSVSQAGVAMGRTEANPPQSSHQIGHPCLVVFLHQQRTTTTLLSTPLLNCLSVPGVERACVRDSAAEARASAPRVSRADGAAAAACGQGQRCIGDAWGRVHAHRRAGCQSADQILVTFAEARRDGRKHDSVAVYGWCACKTTQTRPPACLLRRASGQVHGGSSRTK